ncbi:MAG TPA: hypothetical protein VHL57_03915 [Flavobacteriales bacterium]|jgi:3-hydroxyacyl-[acyl-carrier-protein] dehydratase|nr:hypothetical protein [Flavobacteriales bacterium]
MAGLDGLFTIQQCPTAGTAQGEAIVSLNAAHPIFSGHFPGRPILPGVCTVQIAQAIAERMFGMPLMIRAARSIKFLAPIDPRIAPTLRFLLSLTPRDGSLRIEAQAFVGDTVVMKMTADAGPQER